MLKRPCWLRWTGFLGSSLRYCKRWNGETLLAKRQRGSTHLPSNERCKTTGSTIRSIPIDPPLAASEGGIERGMKWQRLAVLAQEFHLLGQRNLRSTFSHGLAGLYKLLLLFFMWFVWRHTEIPNLL